MQVDVSARYLLLAPIELNCSWTLQKKTIGEAEQLFVGVIFLIFFYLFFYGF
jgi:hypothetical protein